MSQKPRVRELLSKPKEEVASFLGGIYEHSPWVASEFLQGSADSIETISQLAGAMKKVVDESTKERKLELICAHPDLCEKLGKQSELTRESQEEQGRAGLQSLTGEELERFTVANAAYRAKMGFPFILAVRNATKHTVLAALEGRLPNPVEVEFAAALAQVHKIAWMRLLAAINTEDAKGWLTVHVLDTANGCPGENMRVRLERVAPAESAGHIGDFVLNDDGRLAEGAALRGGKDMSAGTYVFTFYVADYFASKGTFFPGTPFLDEVPIRFGIDNPDEHYHIPLLVSPWTYSTYRGS